MINNICVFCSSSESIDKNYFKLANDFATIMGSKNINLVHGAGKIGLMGELSRTIRKCGAKAIGIIPERLHIDGVVSLDDDEIIITKDMQERKAIMREKADAFVVLPGGFGTLEEVAEVITLKQLRYHQKPIVFLDNNNFYKNLFEQFNTFYKEGFTKPEFRNLYFIAKTAEEAMDYILNYTFTKVEDKWL